MSSLEGEKKAKKNVTMLTTIHEAVMVETGKTDFFGNKVENQRQFITTVVEWVVLI